MPQTQAMLIAEGWGPADAADVLSLMPHDALFAADAFIFRLSCRAFAAFAPLRYRSDAFQLISFSLRIRLLIFIFSSDCSDLFQACHFRYSRAAASSFLPQRFLLHFSSFAAFDAIGAPLRRKERMAAAELSSPGFRRLCRALMSAARFSLCRFFRHEARLDTDFAAAEAFIFTLSPASAVYWYFTIISPPPAASLSLCHLRGYALMRAACQPIASAVADRLRISLQADICHATPLAIRFRRRRGCRLLRPSFFAYAHFRLPPPAITFSSLR